MTSQALPFPIQAFYIVIGRFLPQEHENCYILFLQIANLKLQAKLCTLRKYLQSLLKRQY